MCSSLSQVSLIISYSLLGTHSEYMSISAPVFMAQKCMYVFPLSSDEKMGKSSKAVLDKPCFRRTRKREITV